MGRPRFSNLTVLDHPLIQHKLTLLRDRTTSTRDFKQLVSEIAMLMAYEVTKDLVTEPVEIETPLERMTGRMVSGKKLTLVPILRAGLGMATMVVGQLKGDGPGVMAGIDEMNAAVRQAPNSTGVRLTRGFTIIHLPPAMRDTDAVVEDLRFILDTAPGGRPEDVLHVLLGDVYAEMGKLDAARDEYRQVSGASAFAAEQAKLRLEKGSVTPESIAAVRSGTGTRCAMCHAPGVDQ